VIPTDDLIPVPFFNGLPEAVCARLAEAAEVRVYDRNARVVEQHDRAIAVYFLLSGAVQFLIRLDGDDELLVGVGRDVGTLVGWSAFRAPFRYTTSVRCEQGCELIRIPYEAFERVIAEDPDAGVEILHRVAIALARRLTRERDRLIQAIRREGRQDVGLEEIPHMEGGPAVPPDLDLDDPAVRLEQLHHSPFFEGMDDAHLAHIAAGARPVAFPAGATVFAQGGPADDLLLLVDGKVGLFFGPDDEGGDGERVFLRTVNWAGAPLGWSAMVAPHRYHLTCAAMTDARLLALDSGMLFADCRREPAFGLGFLRRILQVIGYRLRTTRIRLVSRRYRKETLAVRALLDQAAETLHVTSPLHKLPFLLANRLTLDDAFQVLNLTRAHGDHGERNLAALCLDVLADVHKELDFYRGLQETYEVVAGAPPDAPPEETRKACMEAFVRLFGQTRYVIRGTEHLPDQPGHIVIMNHLENHPDNLLPNDFRLTLDTHFVSSMILYPKYGRAPIRVIRKPEAGWYGFQQYFDRLDYIYVYAGDVDEEDRDRRLTREDRRRAFLERAQAHLLAGDNVVIAPEGRCAYTEESPKPFKAGAFRLAAFVRPEPLIVPVAVAHFDKQITRTRTAAVVLPPFRLSERVPDPSDTDALFGFVDAYTEEYRGYVREAARLADGG
jgi:CRP-like cAMP-binding protein